LEHSNEKSKTQSFFNNPSKISLKIIFRKKKSSRNKESKSTTMAQIETGAFSSTNYEKTAANNGKFLVLSHFTYN
jgi:hypothetical protein